MPSGNIQASHGIAGSAEPTGVFQCQRVFELPTISSQHTIAPGTYGTLPKQS